MFRWTAAPGVESPRPIPLSLCRRNSTAPTWPCVSISTTTPTRTTCSSGQPHASAIVLLSARGASGRKRFGTASCCGRRTRGRAPPQETSCLFEPQSLNGIDAGSAPGGNPDRQQRDQAEQKRSSDEGGRIPGFDSKKESAEEVSEPQSPADADDHAD